MNKICNLSTVKNTPSEARRGTSCVDYYYIEFCDGTVVYSTIISSSLSIVINVIYNYLDECDIYYFERMYVCAMMTDGSKRRIFKITINGAERHMRISRVR